MEAPSGKAIKVTEAAAGGTGVEPRPVCGQSPGGEMTGPKHESQSKTVLGSKDRDELAPHKRYCYQGDQDRITGWGDATAGLKGHAKRSVFELRGTWPELCF